MDQVPKSKIAAALGAGILVSLLLGWTPAFAHAALVSTDPGDESTVAALPEQATATFSENIGTPAYLIVTAPDGKNVTSGDATALDRTVSVPLKDSDIRGTYTLTYRVVSADGHPIKGSQTFTVEEGRTVKAVTAPANQESFVHKHRDHLAWGIGIAVIAIALLLWPSRRQHG